MIEEKDVNSTAKIEAFIKKQSIRSSTINRHPELRDTAITVTVEFGRIIETPILSSRLMSKDRPVSEKTRVRTDDK